MTRFTCGKCRPVYAGEEYDYRVIDRVDDAAFVFATREAKRIYGKRGFCHHVRKDCWRADGSSVNFEAFVGVPWERTGCSGQNIWLTVNIND